MRCDDTFLGQQCNILEHLTLQQHCCYNLKHLTSGNSNVFTCKSWQCMKGIITHHAKSTNTSSYIWLVFTQLNYILFNHTKPIQPECWTCKKSVSIHQTQHIFYNSETTNNCMFQLLIQLQWPIVLPHFIIHYQYVVGQGTLSSPRPIKHNASFVINNCLYMYTATCSGLCYGHHHLYEYKNTTEILLVINKSCHL
jgi:hypothetical protein